MNSRNRLASLYEEWRLLSESEGDAIRGAAWQRVEHCQNVKADLRGKILTAMENESGGQESAEELRQQFRPVLEHLVSLELRNGRWLAAERSRCEADRDELGQHQRNLRRLHKTYGGRAAV